MSSALNRLDRAADFFNRFHALDPFPDSVLVLAIQPLGVVGADVYRAGEYARPLEMRGVEVRMADYNSFQAALAVDEVDSRLVDKRDEIPEHISLIRLQ